MKIYVSTCDKYDHLLPGFAMMFNKYWGGKQQVDVLGFRNPPPLPKNFVFHSMAPVEKKAWSTYFKNFLINQKGVPHFVFLFDDYWLREPVDLKKVNMMKKYVERGAVKGDLSANTHHFPHRPHRSNKGIVVARQHAPYRSSTQPCIWRRNYMINLLQPGWNPWQFELGAAASNDGRRIVGPTEQLFVYANVFYKGKPAPYMLAKLCDEDLEALTAAGAMKGMPSPEELRRLRGAT